MFLLGLFMKHAKLLISAIVLFATLAIYACAPFPHGGPRDGGRPGAKLSADELFIKADVNGDNFLSKEEFENTLP